MKVGIIGAGMAGLAAAHFLHKRGVDVEVIEAGAFAGGSAHSFVWNGHTCDWAAHRLFTRDEHILQLIQSLTPLRTLDRVSAVRLAGKWLKDPVDAVQLCGRFFPHNTFTVPWTYLTRPRHLPETSFRSYCLAKYGSRLEQFLFSPYTEKMFGIDADRISVEWARKKTRLSGPLDVIRQGSKTKFNYFYYPQKGAFGAIGDALLAPVKDFVKYNARATSIDLDPTGTRVLRVRYERDGQPGVLEADTYVSTLPLTTLCSMTGFESPLTYRSVAAVYVHLNKPRATPNHWIYCMDGKSMPVNRVCEVKNMWPGCGPEDTTVLCAEVTECHTAGFEEAAVRGMADAGIYRMEDVLDTTVVRRDFSYPVYCCDYEKDVDAALAHLSRFANLRSVGRAAQFEHMEIDNCLESALHCVRELTAAQPAAEAGAAPAAGAAAPSRSSLAVEPRVACIIADTGTGDALLRSLDTFRAAAYSRLRLIAVTPDATRAASLRAAYPGLEVLHDASGRHLPSMYNKGIVAALRDGDPADYLFLAQSCVTTEPDALARLVAVAQRDPEAGILAPQLLLAEDPARLWSIGLRFRSFPPSSKNIGRGCPAADYPKSREIDYAVSAALLVSRAAIEAAGLFDPGFSFYYEDMDLSRRVRAHDYRIRYVPEARLYHHDDAPAASPSAFHEAWGESFTRFYRRHMPGALLPLHFAYLILRESLTGNLPRIPALVRGMRRGLQKSLGEPPSIDSADILG
ncbi:MAG: NAD(P)-binding protein [Kiritimatiellae bacterium]|nr:NAD(P)-binding protein [Kiritimatiellia bacterium]